MRDNYLTLFKWTFCLLDVIFNHLILKKNNALFIIILGLVTIPLQNTKLATTKAGEPVLTKTIQLTSAQMVYALFKRVIFQ